MHCLLARGDVGVMGKSALTQAWQVSKGLFSISVVAPSTFQLLLTSTGWHVGQHESRFSTERAPLGHRAQAEPETCNLV